MLTFALAGCARPATHQATAPQPAPILLDSAALRLPLDAYQLSPAQLAQVSRAYHLLVRRCMRSFGVDDPPPATTSSPGLRTLNERRYGITDKAMAAAAGYGLGRRGRAAGVARPPLPTGRALAVLTGQDRQPEGGKPLPPGGCSGQAQRQLAADSPPGADRYLPQRLSFDSFGRSRQDARVQLVMRQWSSCMKTKGLRYTGPLDPPADRRFQHALTRAEIATAMTDIACKRQTNLIGVWFTVESSYQRMLVQQHRAALEQARQANQAERKAAATIGEQDSAGLR